MLPKHEASFENAYFSLEKHCNCPVTYVIGFFATVMNPFFFINPLNINEVKEPLSVMLSMVGNSL
uniref:Uncharacterized protein n=1 Tax=Anguilla anguilla TaxID=7936 RepID=A0A0E9TNA8_ANGAN